MVVTRREEEEAEQELTLFLHLHKQHTTPASAPFGANNNQVAWPKSNIISAVLPRRTVAERFLDSENDKSDCDWLITPPGTPPVTSSESESHTLVMNQMSNDNACPAALHSRLMNVQEEPTSKRNVVSKGMNLSSGLSSLAITGNKKPSSRSATPTGRPTLPATSTKASRSSTPTSRVPSTKSTAPHARSSTPTRTTPQSSTPTARPSVSSTRSSLPATKSASRSATPTRWHLVPSSAANVSCPPGRSSSVSKSVGKVSQNPVPSRGSSPTVKSRSERPASASKVRPGPGGANPRASCSPAKVQASNGSRNSGPMKSRVQTNADDDMNPVLMGTKMVKRVVNMRKLPPPDQHALQNTSSGKSSSLDGIGFGGTLSKNSLDMALRHMDITRNIAGNLRPVMTKIPASSMYSVRSGGSAKSKTTDNSDSPVTTKTNANSEPSVDDTLVVDVIEIDGSEFGSDHSSPLSLEGR